MATFRSFSEIVSTMLQRLRLSQPSLDTKPGSVSRDLFVDLPADELSRLYSALNLVSEKQSLASSIGRDLERLGANFGVFKNSGTLASGILIFATNSLTSDISIPSGTTGTSRGGISFRTVGNYVMSSTDKNRLAANASRLRKSLNIAGLNSAYAIEVPIRAIRPGSAGNVGSLQIINSNLQGAASVVNLTPTTGGTNQESDDSFRARIVAIFSGANTGTSAGYRNSVLGVSGVLDALVVEPGNSLMLRDGTESIELDDGTSRILSSGTGGKVDIYILGRKIEAISESYVFTDLSGSGNIFDERNDYILGQSNQDLTRTSEERRVQAFKEGLLPAQPVDSMVSVVGSSSGALTEAFLDQNGVKRGNFELQKDLNPETGGSPFGFDKIHFISNKKEVEAEPVAKGESYGLDSLEFSDLESLSGVYVDSNETSENSDVSTAGSEFIKLRQTPIVRVSRVQNKTTGEVYSVVNQNLGEDGLNRDGIIKISGRSLPTSADILSVNYTWRKFFDKHIDFSGGNQFQFKTPFAVDVIDWAQSGGVSGEKSIIEKTDDGLNFQVTLDYDISRAISVYSRTEATAIVATVDASGAIGVTLSAASEAVSEGILSIKRDSDLLEVYNTEEGDGSFRSRVIYFPSDTSAEIGDTVTVIYNKKELFDIKDSDGSIYNNVIILPSEGILTENGLFSLVEDAFFSEEDIYVDYVLSTRTVYPKINLSNLPITEAALSNRLTSSSGTGSSSSNQPIFYDYKADSSLTPIIKFSPTPVAVEVSGITSSGKIKLTGITINRYTLDVKVGNSVSGQIFNLEADLKSVLGLTSLPTNIGIARVDAVSLLDEDGEVEASFDILGSSLEDVTYSVGTAAEDSSLSNYTFVIPSTPDNNSISLSAGDIIRVELLVYDSNGAEEIFFSGSSKKTTKNRFGHIERVSVSSGFRSSTGNLVGSIELSADNQPDIGDTYSVDYNFFAPKEGERISISYNVNKLIIDSTIEAERVRPVTADILIKEAEDIPVDVQGTLLINDNALNNSNKIVETVINAISNALNTSVLGGTVDYSDIIATAAAVDGVDSVNISIFNENGKTGRIPFIRALDNQFVSPGEILFEAVSRNKFRIN